MHGCYTRKGMSEIKKTGLFGSFRMSGKKDKTSEPDNFVLSSPTAVRRDSMGVTGWGRGCCSIFFGSAFSEGGQGPLSPVARSSSTLRKELGEAVHDGKGASDLKRQGGTGSLLLLTAIVLLSFRLKTPEIWRTQVPFLLGRKLSRLLCHRLRLQPKVQSRRGSLWHARFCLPKRRM